MSTPRTVSAGVEPWSWPTSELGRGLELLAAELGLGDRRQSVAPATEAVPPDDDEGLRAWLEAAAVARHLEVEPVSAPYGELDELVDRSAPALLRLPPTEKDGPVSWALVLGRARSFPGRPRRVRLLGPSGEVHAVPVAELVFRLQEAMAAPYRAGVTLMLERAGVPPKRIKAGVEALMSRRLAEVPLDDGFLLRPEPGSDFRRRLARIGAGRSLALLAGVHALQYALWLVAWWLIGRSTLGGTLDAGWMTAWVLLLLTLVPLRMAGAWLMGTLSIRVGAELKLRLLHGALSLDRDEVRTAGAGESLGRVIEAEAVESLALGGGLMVVTALVELPFALWVLSLGVSGGPLVLLAALTLGFAAWTSYRFHRALGGWTERRLAMTLSLVEKMVGHGTRLIQEADRGRHRGEDLELKDYLQHVTALDRILVRLLLLPRGFALGALVVLAPAFVSGGGGAGGLAVSVGGMLLLQGTLAALASGLSTLGAAWISWGKVEPLFRAGAVERERGLPHLAREARAGADGVPVVRAKGVTYRYPARDRPALVDVDLAVHPGDRVLVEGPSGGGKSTLASLLVGLRRPTAGSLSLHGLDRGSLGLEAWRKRVVLVPQFHENHVLTETFAFNLLMGLDRRPSRADLGRALEVCRELGLGDLVGRMPAGLQQVVGETGWQLSHGERSRLFLARALLQEADLLIFDESFAALDPENLGLALDCARKRGHTLMVVAHP